MAVKKKGISLIKRLAERGRARGDVTNPSATAGKGKTTGDEGMTAGQKKRAPLADRRREFDDLPKDRQRGEMAKGSKSRFADIIEARFGKAKPTRQQLDALRDKASRLNKGGLKKAKSTYNKGGVAKKKPVKKLAKGGFPDLTGDGKVTKKDVLKGRGVAMNMGGMKKQYGAKNYMSGGYVMGKKKK